MCCFEVYKTERVSAEGDEAGHSISAAAPGKVYKLNTYYTFNNFNHYEEKRTEEKFETFQAAERSSALESDVMKVLDC